MTAVFAQEVTRSFVAPEVDWSLIMPFVLLAVGGVLLVTISSLVPFARANWFPAVFTGAVSVAAMWSLRSVWSTLDGSDGPVFIMSEALAIDRFSVLATLLICVAILFMALILPGYLQTQQLEGTEWYVLLLMSAAGGVLLASANDLIITFLGLEILSIALYVLASLHLRRSDGQEGGFKYFVLGALSSAILLYGIALTYGATGTTSLRGVALTASLTDPDAIYNINEDSSMILAAMAMLMVGFAFKVAAAPFHMWTPDVYQASPSPIVGFMASAVKVAGFAGMARVFWLGFAPFVSDWQPLLAGLSLLTLLIGSILAVSQTDVKRMLAYSSITHAGFILLAMHTAGAGSLRVQVLGAEAFTFYLAAYSVMVLGTFAVVTAVGSDSADGGHSLDDYRGLARRAPVLSAFMVILLFAQAGVPFTSGFLAKFKVILAAASGEAYFLAGVAMVAAAISAFLYLRIVVSVFLSEPALVSVSSESADDIDGEVTTGDPDGQPPQPLAVPIATMFAVALAAVVTLGLGIIPQVSDGAITDVISGAAASLTVLFG